MKKFTFMLAALSLCAGAFTACGGDDSSDSKNAVGESCSVAGDCESGVCTDGKCAAKDATDKKADGQACAANDDCVSGNCKDKVCAAKDSNNKKANGEACTANDDCVSGNCKDNVCAAKENNADKKADGQACTANDDCVSGNCKDKVCAAKNTDKKADGETCTANDDCVSGNCKDNVCAAKNTDKKADGETCTANDDCVSGNCKDNVCAAKNTDKKANGNACAANDDCISNYCDETAKVCADSDKSCTPDDFTPNCSNGKILYTCVNNVITAEDCSARSDGNTECKESDTGAQCAAPISSGDCFVDSDCKDRTDGKTVCGSGNVCVAPAPAEIDPCKDAACGAGSECILGICVTDTMKDAAVESTFIGDTDYCVGSKLYYSDNNGKLHITDCAAENAGTCTVAKFDGKTLVDCSGNEDMIDRCSKSHYAMWPLCYPNTTKWYTFFCINDVTGKPVAVPNYDKDQGHGNCADSSQVCGYDADGKAVCQSKE